jgi:hypothetical protein
MVTSPLVARLAIYGIALAWTLLVQLPLSHLDGIDEVFYIEVAHLWSKGVLPYAGAFDVKPPGFFALVAASQLVLGPSPASARAIAIAFDAVTATALFFLGRRFGAPRVGLFAAIVYPPLSELVAFNDCYSALGALTTLAVLAALSPLRLVGRAALTGFAVGAAFSIKQTAAFEAIVLFFTLVGAIDAAGRRTTAVLAFVSGASIVPVGFLAYFAWHGAARAMIDDAVIGALMRPASAAEGLTFIDGILLFLPLHRSILGLFVVACLALLRRRALAEALPGAPLAVLEAWFLAALLATLVQRSIHVAYLSQTLPPALLLAGLCAARATPEFGRAPEWARLGALALMSLATAVENFGHLTNRHPTRAIAEATTAIRATGPSRADRLFAVNRGLWLNVATSLDPPTRYIHPAHTLCEFNRRSADNLTDALAAAPRYIVVADRRARLSCERPERWDMIEATLRNGYRLIVHAAEDSESYDVYERVTASDR